MLLVGWMEGLGRTNADLACADLQKMGCEKPVLRMGKMKAGPVVTDNGCVFVLSASAGNWLILLEQQQLCYRRHLCRILHARPGGASSPDQDVCFVSSGLHGMAFDLERCRRLTGVLEVGIFAGMALAAYFGNPVRPSLSLSRSLSALTWSGS